MRAYIFPGQGSQFPGMGRKLYDGNIRSKHVLNQSNDVLGYDLTKVMFEGSAEDLKKTQYTQPAIFTYSFAMTRCMEEFDPAMVAGHSLGELSAITAVGMLNFREGLTLVSKRSQAMAEACKLAPSGMAAILGMDDEDKVKEICEGIDGVVVPANYNCPGQLVISGEMKALNEACELIQEAGARRALKLPVSGGFHSPMMEPARKELEAAIDAANWQPTEVPVYQNCTGTGTTDLETIKENLKIQLTAPVLWTQTIRQMIKDGATEFQEIGPGKVLRGLLKKIDPEAEATEPNFV